MDVGCLVDSWNPIAIGSDFINGEACTLMFRCFMAISNHHFCDMMILGDDCMVLDRVAKTGLTQSPFQPEDTVKQCVKSVQLIVGWQETSFTQ